MNNQMRINPAGLKRICQIILDKKTPPLVDPYAKKEPFWTVVLPEGTIPLYDDAIKVTLKEWEKTMKMRWPHPPKLKAGVGDAAS